MFAGRDVDVQDAVDGAGQDNEAAPGAAAADGDANVVPLSTEAGVAPSTQKKISNTMRDALFSDAYIHRTAMELEIPESERMKMSENQRLVFFLKKDFFLDWKAQHEIYIGTSFVKHSEREYKIEASKDTRWRDSRIGHVAINYVCQRRGKPPVVKNRVPGGQD
ncbi:hypothetical protein BGZ98_008767 [Dissophora globulifera]|nr:hypothetical protein BGZ98_008767 [Dissophora globulifera]